MCLLSLARPPPHVLHCCWCWRADHWSGDHCVVTDTAPHHLSSGHWCVMSRCSSAIVTIGHNRVRISCSDFDQLKVNTRLDQTWFSVLSSLQQWHISDTEHSWPGHVSPVRNRKLFDSDQYNGGLQHPPTPQPETSAPIWSSSSSTRNQSKSFHQWHASFHAPSSDEVSHPEIFLNIHNWELFLLKIILSMGHSHALGESWSTKAERR